MPKMLKLLLFNFNVADFIDSVPVAMHCFIDLAEVDNLSDRVSARMQLFLIFSMRMEISHCCLMAKSVDLSISTY